MKFDEFIKKIKPNAPKNQSDKYSFLFYKFLNKNKDRLPFKYDFKILYDESYQQFNPSFPQIENMFVGGTPIKDEPHTFFGNRINSIICDISDDVYCIYPWAHQRSIIDITEWFTEQYIKIGRCLFDPEHINFITNPETRFSKIHLPNFMQFPASDIKYYDDRKYCNWCGKVLFKTYKEEVVVKQIETWTAY